MPGQSYIQLKKMEADDSARLTVLKTSFNIYASKLNMSGYTLSEVEVNELLDKINSLENLINTYNH